ncbi:MAG: hypothetical protein NO474_03050 [Methanomassiliicoccales archaeon]|jgi:hypothetical protein|nr:hypothetical protein [Methanomassiliicoccales archaeon]
MRRGGRSFLRIKDTLSQDNEDATLCLYTKSEGRLEINCCKCQGKQDLRNPRCFESVIKILSIEPGVDEIILMGDQDVSYDKSIIKILQHASKIESSFFSTFANFNFNRHCTSCHINPRFLLGLVIDRLSVKDIRLPLGNHFEHQSEKCQICSEKLEFWLKCASTEIEAIERIVARELFMVVTTNDEGRN